MNFRKHSTRGAHAFLSPSNYHWINYSVDKLRSVYENALAAEEGTRLHEFAEKCIVFGRPLSGDDVLARYVNDCILEGMQAEELLWYSDNCFGTADAIRFEGNSLKIFDLKTGKSGNIMQLMIYAALFCLEYDYDPWELDIELRLYILDEVQQVFPKAEEITAIMAKIMELDSVIESIKEERA